MKKSLRLPYIRLPGFFGCKIPPPLLASFKINACFMGIYYGFGLTFSFFVMSIVKGGHINPLLVFMIIFPLSGLPFGLIMAGYYRFKANSLELLRDAE